MVICNCTLGHLMLFRAFAFADAWNIFVEYQIMCKITNLQLQGWWWSTRTTTCSGRGWTKSRSSSETFIRNWGQGNFVSIVHSNSNSNPFFLLSSVPALGMLYFFCRHRNTIVFKFTFKMHTHIWIMGGYIKKFYCFFKFVVFGFRASMLWASDTDIHAHCIWIFLILIVMLIWCFGI